jgi:hypothetical protein
MALWLGHADIRSTDAYIHADLTIKERALAATMPASARPGRYQPPDATLAFLESLYYADTRDRQHSPKSASTRAAQPRPHRQVGIVAPSA